MLNTGNSDSNSSQKVMQPLSAGHSKLLQALQQNRHKILRFCVAVVILHASLRLRNVKNKIAGKVEYIGVCRTPMGLVLEALGMEQEAAS